MNKEKHTIQLELQKEINKSKQKLMDNLYNIGAVSFDSTIEHNEMVLEIYFQEINEYYDYIIALKDELLDYKLDKKNEGNEDE